MMRRRSLPLFALLALLLAGCGDAPDDRSAAPVARRVPHVDLRHDREVVDPYHWLRDREDPEVIAHLEAENRYTDEVTAPAADFADTLYAEMKGRIVETDLAVPVRIDDWWYYTRTEAGKSYRRYCRKRRSLEAEEEVYLDANALAEGHDFLSVGVVRVSPDHRWLAYSTDVTGRERYTIRIRDLSTGEDLPERIPETSWSVRWANDSRTLFYNTRDAANRPYRVHRHVRGTDPEKDVLVYEEADERYSLGIGKTKDRRYLLIVPESNSTAEVWLLDADRPESEAVLVEPRRTGVEYYVRHRKGTLYIRTNDKAVNFRLVTAPVSEPGKESWKDLVAHREDVTLGSVQVFDDFLVLSEREGGYRGLRYRDFESGAWRRIQPPEAASTVWLGGNPMSDARKIRFSYTSLLTPMSVVDYDVDTGESEVLKVREVRGGYDPTAYRSERIFADAPDGTKVPISLAWREDLRGETGNPLLLAGYGAYGASSDPIFSSHRLSLLDRGVVYAIAHVRGGSEMGRRWYEQGKLLRKVNSFTDFVACAEHLVETGRTSPDRLAIRGGSAGGLLVGAAVNLRPDLFRAVVARMPFVDVVNTMFDSTIPLTAAEWEEWGDPRKPDEYAAMMAWSPYDNVKAVPYPAMLVVSGLNDPRVAFWEPVKWVARLRARTTGDRPILLRTHMGSGHSGSSGRYDRLRERAFETAFLLRQLGKGE